MKEETEKEKTVYNADSQPKKDKQSLSLMLGMFFSFNLLFFIPYDFYLANMTSLMIAQKYLFMAIVPVTLIGIIAVSCLCFFTKGKAHIITCSVVFGLGLAMYIQANFLSLSMHSLDGTKYQTTIPKALVNIVIWALIIALPFFIYRKNQEIFLNFLSFVGAMIMIVEIFTVSATYIKKNISEKQNNENIFFLTLNTRNKTKMVSSKDLFTYSKTKNFIILVADEYDSYCFDYTRENAPETLSGFDGFTYYPNTTGMYAHTHAAISNALTREHKQVKDVDYENTAFFDAVKKQYKVDLYTQPKLFTKQVYEDYADNYIEMNITGGTILNLGKCFCKLAMFKAVPEAFKSFFYIYTDDFSNVFSNVQSYYDDTMAFYRNLNSKLDLIDEPCFKYIHMNGLHDPRYITADLKEAEPWSVSADEQAVAVNKILSAYLELLQKHGIYEDACIVLMADHGLKDHEYGRYPMFMIKMPGDNFEELKINNAPVSYDDLYPTLMKLAGEDTGETTIFELEEGQKRERYFAETDEYIKEDVKK